MFIIGYPIFFNKTKLILLELFFLSLAIKDNILFKSRILKNLFIFDGKLAFEMCFKIEDKSFLHKNHAGNQEGKFHLKISLISSELKIMNKIESNKKIYKILDKEMKESVHSIQILIS